MSSYEGERRLGLEVEDASLIGRPGFRSTGENEDTNYWGGGKNCNGVLTQGPHTLGDAIEKARGHYLKEKDKKGVKEENASAVRSML